MYEILKNPDSPGYTLFLTILQITWLSFLWAAGELIDRYFDRKLKKHLAEIDAEFEKRSRNLQPGFDITTPIFLVVVE